jgi:hypothetical protein
LERYWCCFRCFLQEIISERRVVPAGILEFPQRGKAKTADIARDGAIPTRRIKICAQAITISTHIYQ